MSMVASLSHLIPKQVSRLLQFRILSLPFLHFLWVSSCIIFIFKDISIRTLRYWPTVWPPEVYQWFGEQLYLQFRVGMFSMFLFVQLFAVAGGVIFILFIVKRSLCFEVVEGKRTLSPWIYSLIWLGVAVYNLALDAEARIGVIGFLLIVLITFHHVLKKYIAYFRVWWSFPCAILVLGGVLSVVLFGKADWYVLGIIVLGFSLIALRASSLLGRDRLLLLVIYLGFAQGLNFFLPSDLEGDGFVYQKVSPNASYMFCESESTNRVYGIIPRYRSGIDYIDGRLMSFNAQSLERTQDVSFFNRDYYGRFVYLLCVDPLVHIGVSIASVDQKFSGEHVILADLSHPEIQIQKFLAEDDIGHRMTYDKKRNAVYYVGESSDKLYRYDVDTGKLQKDLQKITFKNYPRPDRNPESFGLDTYSIHYGRNSLFLAEWLSGSELYELDLDTHELKQVYRINNGGIHGMVIDETYHRAYIAGVWGVDILDLETGRLSHRTCGFTNRTPSIDAKRGLVFVTSSVDGRLCVFDQETMRLLKRVSLGTQTRFAMASERTGRLWVSSWLGTYAFDTDQMVSEVRDLQKQFRTNEGTKNAFTNGVRAVVPDWRRAQFAE